MITAGNAEPRGLVGTRTRPSGPEWLSCGGRDDQLLRHHERIVGATAVARKRPRQGDPASHRLVEDDQRRIEGVCPICSRAGGLADSARTDRTYTFYSSLIVLD